ncbi:uncharacterized protein LOC135394760 isoform X2 [Ornithodoros turicata]|uniref:uncharacterized protein LOC135394760 isoform X2 n=1 Tax=Ornithodoros turicata TaxID=34597 RepID=UPI003138CD46
MPKKKRYQRVREETYTGRTSRQSTYSSIAASPASELPDNVIRNNFAIGEDVDPAECLKYLQEVFHGKLDPDVIHMVLTECEFNVDVALEGLLTLLNEPPENGPSLLLSMPKGPKISNLSSSSSSESVATENIVTSEAEVHKSSEESERESLRGMDIGRTSSAFGQSSDPRTHKSKLSSPSLADLVDAPPFVPSTNYAAPPLYSEVSKLPDPDVAQETTAHGDFRARPSASKAPSAKAPSVSAQEDKIRMLVGHGEKVLVLLRGLPGSGKTTLAEKIRGGGVVLSTDHFFYKRDAYKFDKTRLPEAHEWNKGRVKRAVEEGRTPVIVDNTNIEAWEMMPYVAIALRGRYHVVVLEPDTPWKFNVRQLARRNVHGVQSRSLELMLARYDRDVTAESLCRSLGLSQKSPESPERGDVSAPPCGEADPLKDLSWRKAMESAGDEKVENCEHEATPVAEETISLQDLMVLVQNDSEESSNRSRQSSGSWSSEQECNDWEEVTDDDFLWKASAKNAIMKKHSVQSAIEEEPELCGTQGESDAEQGRRTDLNKGLMEVHESEAMGDAPKPQRPSENFRAIAKAVHPSEKDEEISFSESWNPQDNREVEVLGEGPKPQRQRESPKKRGSPTRASATEKEGLREEFDEVLVTKSLENLTLASTESSEKAKGSKSLESISKVSSKISQLAGHRDVQRRSKQHKVFGLERSVRDVSWSIPEFTSCESLQACEKKSTTALAMADDWSPAYSAEMSEFMSCESLLAHQKKDATTLTTADDWSLVHYVLTGKSNELPLIVPRDTKKTTNIESPVPKRDCNLRDQSTTTTDLPAPELDPLDRLELLQQCIPEASKPDLEDIFHQCHGDHMWAADLLLESGTVGDLKPLVIREEAEESAESVISSEPEEKKDAQFQQQVAKEQSNNMHTFHQPSASGQPVLYGDYGSCGEYFGGETYYRCEAANYYTVDGAYESMANGHGMEAAEQDSDPPFLLTLTPAFASQLVETFGSDGLHVSTDAFNREDLSVAISHSLAREVHRLWMQTLRQTLNREDQEMIEMAQETRRQQNQEDQRGASPNESTRLTQDSDFPIPPPPQWTKPSHEMSFKEIMEMEAELEKRRKERIKKSDTDMATKLKNQKLYDKFPGIDRQALDEIFAANNYSLLQSVSTINETLGIDPSVSDAAEHQEAIAELVMAESRMQEEEDMAWCPTVEGHENMYERLQVFGDYDALRKEATVHYHLRQESFQKAKSAYHRGMKTVAAFYSQQGRLHAEKMRTANERASGILFDLRNASCDDNTLDLHGLHVQEAIQVLKNFVKLKKREAWCLQKRMVLRVITGRGAHSSHNIPKVKFAVEGYLRSSQLNYDEMQAGMFHIKL